MLPMDDLKHLVIQEIKRVASHLGRKPSRSEYRNHSLRPYSWAEKAFGSWSNALAAAGFNAQEKPCKPKQQFEKEFLQPISSSLSHEKYTARQTPYVRTAVAGDLHLPWASEECLTAFYTFIEKEQPVQIIQVGDLYDMYSHAKFPRSRHIYNPAEEIETGFKMAKDFWETCKKLVPNARFYQILGNHDVRPLKRVIEAYPEGEYFFSFDKYFQFEGVQTFMDVRKELILDGIVYMHGYASRLGQHCEAYKMPVVCGHTHRGGVYYQDTPTNGMIFELNAGFMGDVQSKVLQYTSMKFTKWTHGFGYIDEWGPRFIPL